MLMEKIKREWATWREILYFRMHFTAKTEKDVLDNFHRLYYDSGPLNKTWTRTRWMDVPDGRFGISRSL